MANYQTGAQTIILRPKPMRATPNERAMRIAAARHLGVSPAIARRLADEGMATNRASLVGMRQGTAEADRGAGRTGRGAEGRARIGILRAQRPAGAGGGGARRGVVGSQPAQRKAPMTRRVPSLWATTSATPQSAPRSVSGGNPSPARPTAAPISAACRAGNTPMSTATAATTRWTKKAPDRGRTRRKPTK